MKTIWVDIADSRQANLLMTLAKELTNKADLIITTSSQRQPQLIVKHSGFACETVDAPESITDPVARYASRIHCAMEVVRKAKPNLLISDLDASAVRTAFGLGIPVWCLYGARRENGASWKLDTMSYPLCDRIFASSFHSQEELFSSGLRSRSVTSFDGWNESYLAKQRACPTPDPIGGQGILVRTNGLTDALWLKNLLDRLSAVFSDVRILVLDQSNSNHVRKLVQTFAQADVTPFLPYPPCSGQDAFVGWGRSVAESFVLGVPCINIDHFRYDDLAAMYQHIPSPTDAQTTAELCSEIMTRSGRREFEKKSLRVTGKLASPIDVITDHLAEDGYI